MAPPYSAAIAVSRLVASAEHSAIVREARAMGLVIEWASKHQSELMDYWNLSRAQAELRKIDPLE